MTREPSTGVELPLQYLTFTLGDEVCAIGIRSVREIIQYAPLTTVPLMPDFVRGVINLRGAVVPVIDLQSRFGRAQSQVGKKTCIVIFDAVTDGESNPIGLWVDAVTAVIDIAPDAMEPPPQFGASLRRDFIQGIGKVEGRFVIVLDPRRAFDIDDMGALCTASHGAATRALPLAA